MEIIEKTATIEGVPFIITAVICTRFEREKLERRKEKGLRAFVEARGLHRVGEGDMFICFLEPPRGDARAEPAMCFATVHESDRGSATLAWPREKQEAAGREALRILTDTSVKAKRSTKWRPPR